MNARAVVYDLEILKAIPQRNEPKLPKIDYCAGWHDHAGMGISVLCCYDSLEERVRVFCKDNMSAFSELAKQADLLVGFNNIAFDDVVLAANGVEMPADVPRYDLLSEMWKAAGFGPKWSGSRCGGFGLDATAFVNLGVGKSGNGALAPVQWQRGEIGSVVDYCLRDVELTTKLFVRAAQCHGRLVDPRNHAVNVATGAPSNTRFGPLVLAAPKVPSGESGCFWCRMVAVDGSNRHLES